MITRLIFPAVCIIAFALATTVNFSSCKSDHMPAPDCYDSALKAQHENDLCTEEWRGVKGCDGKLYGNECQANAQGIAIVP
jgi:hypothetical protein